MDIETEQNREWCLRLYEAKSAGFILYGRALGLSHFEAEDVLQETFIALLKRATAPREPEHYALRSFRNRATNYRRSLWRRLTRELESKRWFESTEGVSEEEEAAIRALSELPADQREAIVLKIWNQYTFEEIGRLLDVSPNTVAGRYRYGLQKLKSALTRENHEKIFLPGETATLFKASPRLARS